MYIIGLIILYIIGLICPVLSRILEYILGSQGMHEYDEAHCRGGIYLICICIKAGDVDIEPRFLPVVPDCSKIREICEKAVKKYL